MARGFTFIILLVIAPLPCLILESQVKPPTEILNSLKRKLSDPVKASLLLDLAIDYVYKTGEFSGDLDIALLLTTEAEKIIGLLGNKRFEARTYFVYSNILRDVV